MKIRPLIGLDNLFLGTSKEAAKDLLGNPEETWTEEFVGGIKSDEWRFSKKQIELSFDSDDAYVLSSITVCNPESRLDGLSVIGIPLEELLLKFPGLQLDDDFEELGKDYVLPEAELSFWVVDDEVQSVTIFPKYEDDNETVTWPSIS
jgi:hypothetical protein